jgi:hypothetical protein
MYVQIHTRLGIADHALTRISIILLAFSTKVVLGFGPPWNPWPYVLPLSKFTCFEMGSLSLTLTQSQSQSYFTTGGLPPISSSWRQVPWDLRPDILFQRNSCGNTPYITSSLTRRWVALIQRQSQSYFTTGGLPPISSSWRQAPWDSLPDIFLNELLR